MLKLLGQFDKEIGNEYIDFLKKSGIEVKAEDVPVYKIIANIYRPIGRTVVELKLFIDDKDYDKAMQEIKEYEQKQQREVKIDGQKVYQVMLMITFCLLIFMALYFYFFNFKH